MKPLNVFIAALVLTCFLLPPVAARADEDLEDIDVMMEVLDDEADLDDDIADMARTREPQDVDDDWDEVEPGKDEEAGVVGVEDRYGDHVDDDFESADEIDDVDEIDDDQRDHEEGEDVEEDVFEDDTEDADEPME
jgi:hypothetical protein